MQYGNQEEDLNDNNEYQLNNYKNQSNDYNAYRDNQRKQIISDIKKQKLAQIPRRYAEVRDNLYLNDELKNWNQKSQSFNSNRNNSPTALSKSQSNSLSQSGLKYSSSKNLISQSTNLYPDRSKEFNDLELEKESVLFSVNKDKYRSRIEEEYNELIYNRYPKESIQETKDKMVDYISKIMEINDQLEPEDRIKNEKLILQNLQNKDQDPPVYKYTKKELENITFSQHFQPKNSKNISEEIKKKLIRVNENNSSDSTNKTTKFTTSYLNNSNNESKNTKITKDQLSLKNTSDFTLNGTVIGTNDTYITKNEETKKINSKISLNELIDSSDMRNTSKFNNYQNKYDNDDQLNGIQNSQIDGIENTNNTKDVFTQNIISSKKPTIKYQNKAKNVILKNVKFTEQIKNGEEKSKKLTTDLKIKQIRYGSAQPSLSKSKIQDSQIPSSIERKNE